MKKPGRGLWLIAAGGLLTVVWLGLLVTFAYLRWDKIVLLDPNSAGDFLAGAFAPLAFLWLVLGFFQQGIELRNSGEALWLQGEELRNSVEQQRELVSAARDQLEFDRTVIAQRNEEAVRTAQPSFKLVYEGMVERRNGSALQSFRLINTGKDCFDLNFAISGGPDDPTSDYNDDVVKNGTWARIQIWIANDFDGELLARVTYKDGLNNDQAKEFAILVEEGGFHIQEAIQPLAGF